MDDIVLSASCSLVILPVRLMIFCCAYSVRNVLFSVIISSFIILLNLPYFNRGNGREFFCLFFFFMFYSLPFFISNIYFQLHVWLHLKKLTADYLVHSNLSVKLMDLMKKSNVMVLLDIAGVLNQRLAKRYLEQRKDQDEVQDVGWLLVQVFF